MSDSHGRVEWVRRAIALFDEAGVELIIHCGDVGGEAVFEEFVGRAFHFVWGNTDDAGSRLVRLIGSLGIALPNEVPLRLGVDGKRFAVFHGHEEGFDEACDALDVDYICHGHTHVARDVRSGSRRIINPGALHRAPQKTVAILDPSRDRLERRIVPST